MSDNNGWPDPARPGVPVNPEREWFYWLENKITKNLWCACWRAKESYWGHPFNLGDPAFIGAHWRYLGPCLTPAEVEARVAEARRDARLTKRAIGEFKYRLREAFQ
ncbi:MAG: hypothetical protein ING08_08120 [Roseomonas sp.]|nr:hypothetical protein [Roseomonas sp.]